jgi:hypothetical protein
MPEPISSSATSKAGSTCSASSAPSATAYHVHKLIEKHGRKGNMMKWQEMLNADCPKREAA